MYVAVSVFRAMKKRNLLIASLLVALLIVGVSVYAQVNRTYHPGSVWNLSFIRIKPGMDTAYLNYVAGQWKAEQEAQKKDGNILCPIKFFQLRRTRQANGT